MIDSSFQDTCRICLEFGEEEDHKRKTEHVMRVKLLLYQTHLLFIILSQKAEADPRVTPSQGVLLLHTQPLHKVSNSFLGILPIF